MRNVMFGARFVNENHQWENAINDETGELFLFKEPEEARQFAYQMACQYRVETSIVRHEV